MNTLGKLRGTVAIVCHPDPLLTGYAVGVVAALNGAVPHVLVDGLMWPTEKTGAEIVYAQNTPDPTVEYA